MTTAQFWFVKGARVAWLQESRRRWLVPLLLVAVCMTAVGASTSVASGETEPLATTTTHGTGLADTGTAELPSFSTTDVAGSSAQADGVFAPPVELQRVRDRAGAIWRAITRESKDGRCIEVEAVSAESGQRLGMLGGCGLPEVDYDGATGFRSVRSAPLLLPIAGDLNNGPARGTIVFGVASCNCNVRATFSDGTMSAARARRGFYLVHREGVGAVLARIEALDDAGQILTSHELPAPPETPVIGDVLGRVG